MPRFQEVAFAFVALVSIIGAEPWDSSQGRLLEEHDVAVTLQDAISGTFTTLESALELTWPFVTSSVFSALSTGYLDSAPEAKVVAYCPVVTADDRSNWEVYSTINKGWVEAVSGSPQTIPSSIFSLAEGETVTETGSGPYCPLWQHNVLEPSLVNFNMLSLPEVAEAFTVMASSLEPAKFPIIGDVPFDVSSEEGSMFWLVNPILSDSTQDVVGLVVSVISESDNTPSVTPMKVTDNLLGSISDSFSGIAAEFQYSWPFVTSPIFSTVGSAFLDVVSTAEVLISCPMVSEEDKGNWEAYASFNQGWIDQVGGVPDGESVAQNIFNLDDQGNQVAETGKGTYCPLWQHTAFDSKLVNLDLLSIPAVANAFADISSSLEPTVVPVEGDLPFGIEKSDDTIYLWAVHPIFDDTGSGDVPVGLVAAIVSEPASPSPTTEPVTMPPPVGSPTKSPTTSPNESPSKPRDNVDQLSSPAPSPASPPSAGPSRLGLFHMFVAVGGAVVACYSS